MPRRWIVALALAWGLTIGCLVALLTALGLLAVGWVYLFGDDPWPDHFTQVAVPAVAGGAGLVGIAAAAVLGARLRRAWPGLGRRLQSSPAMRWGALAAPLLILGALALTFQRQEAATALARAEAEALASRQAQAHRLVTADWELHAAGGRLRIALAASGALAGDYRLRWKARGPGTDAPLAAGIVRRSLPAGPGEMSLELDADELARRYAQAILSRPQAVLIDLPHAIELSLALEPDGSAESRLILQVPLSFAYEPGGAVAFDGDARR